MAPSNARAAIVTVLAAVSLLTPNVARSETSIMLNCTPYASLSAGKDPIVRATIDLLGHDWLVTYFAKSGASYRRHEQYDLTDTSDVNERSWYSWRGVLKGRPYLVMTGRMHYDGDHSSYSERLVDHRPHSGAVLSLTWFACAPSTTGVSSAVRSHDDMVIFDAKNAREMARDAEETHLEHPEVAYRPYQADPRLTEKAEELQPFFDDWQYEYISAACKLGRWKDKEVSNLDREFDPFDREFFSNSHKLFRDGRDEFVAMRHLQRVFYAEHPELLRAHNEEHETEPSNCSGDIAGVGGVTVCVTTDICSAVERSPGFQKIRTLFGDWPPPPTPILPRSSHSAANSESKCSPITDIKQQLVCYENTLQDEQLSEHLQADITDPNSVIHGICVDSYFPIGFPIDYSACYRLIGGLGDSPWVVVAKSGASVVTSGGGANGIFDQNGTRIGEGDIFFWAKGPPVGVDGIYVQDINSTAIELPKFDSQFANKGADGKYSKGFINSEGHCAWRAPFAQTKFFICDVNSAVGSFHIVFKRGPFQQH